MLGVRIKNGAITNCSVVDGMDNEQCHLSVGRHEGAQGTGRLPEFRLSAAALAQPDLKREPHLPRGGLPADRGGGHDGDILITGLPLSPVEHVLGQVALAELVVFLSVLLLAGILGTILVRLSLRPLRRVAATATRVTELPLDSGEVTLPDGVPDSDPRTEVGQVGAAFNRMLTTLSGP